ncbi:transcriptional regulator, MarR family [Desulfatibacillum aliphaticivorans]|uniref:Transcriptional regulator, MarR family n=1 Tax=Desulfatibacillum aliphaticivorans TaxID=218208 RepID=B8FAM0_DESAL|nr:MarR family transcriptional regulator [Desulfatibacillum aliphaticivorans]ACL03316.1 transcriptional regulator, MarR family [Desulfatibacillum aliphaticivorans]
MNVSPPEEYLYFLLNRASLSVTSLFKKALKKNGLPQVKPSYLGVLICLWRKEAMDELLSKLGSQEGMPLGELGKSAGVEPSTITGLIDRMEKDGLVQRSQVPGDRRSHRAVLTDKGSALRNEALQAMLDMEQEAFAGIDPEDLAVFKSVLKQVLANAK